MARNRNENEEGHYRKEGHLSKGTEAGNVIVSHSFDHNFSAGVAKFHCCTTIKIFVCLLYMVFIAMPSTVTNVIFYSLNSNNLYVYRSLEILFFVEIQAQIKLKCLVMTPSS